MSNTYPTHPHPIKKNHEEKHTNKKRRSQKHEKEFRQFLERHGACGRGGAPKKLSGDFRQEESRAVIMNDSSGFYSEKNFEILREMNDSFIYASDRIMRAAEQGDGVVLSASETKSLAFFISEKRRKG